MTNYFTSGDASMASHSANFSEILGMASQFAALYGIEPLERLMDLAGVNGSTKDNSSSDTIPMSAQLMGLSIVEEVEAAGIEINDFLERLILENERETVLDALAVVQQNQSRTIVHNPTGLFVEAIRHRWKPN